MARRVDPMKTLSALRPKALDERAEEAHSRDRERGIARALAGPRQRAGAAAPRRRMATTGWRTGLLGGLAGAAVLAVAAVVVTAEGAEPAATVPPVPEESGPAYADASEFMLASADRLSVPEPTEGDFWHLRTRSSSPTFAVDSEVDIAASVEYSTESWTELGGEYRILNNLNLDAEVSFASEEDRRAWEEAGSPELSYTEPASTYYEGVGQHVSSPISYTDDELRELPGTAEELRAELERKWDGVGEDDYLEGRPDFTSFVQTLADRLLVGPVAPDTRAAAYQVIAELPNVRLLGEVTDQLGREGVGVAIGEADDEVAFTSDGGPYEQRWVFDEETGLLLASELRTFDDSGEVRAVPGSWTAYEAIAVTEEMGEPVVEPVRQ
ncbi:CU044_5270 family protein [Allonocardiopsis opalescens]|uniref:CU044_5270 family protein n=1 Tax=Allonocardiopsis opalescens TaxID=1144618 RepID=A0A2T0Q850_9ACTN|nr:CU044_5270 family protein [Allonocardiopsis opalescens]PRX99968.1 hypothetical protein CLV72_103579 [Allonocardiopsis opalescens]